MLCPDKSSMTLLFVLTPLLIHQQILLSLPWKCIQSPQCHHLYCQHPGSKLIFTPLRCQDSLLTDPPFRSALTPRVYSQQQLEGSCYSLYHIMRVLPSKPPVTSYPPQSQSPRPPHVFQGPRNPFQPPPLFSLPSPFSSHTCSTVSEQARPSSSGLLYVLFLSLGCPSLRHSHGILPTPLQISTHMSLFL